MPLFNFYSFELVPVNQPIDLFSSAEAEAEGVVAEPQEAPDASLDARLGSLFTTGKQLLLHTLIQRGSGRNKTSEWEKYTCDVLRHEAGVVLLTIDNNKVKYTTVNKKERSNEHHPYCHVVIDNRPDRGIIGIERNAAFDSRTDRVADILREGLTYELRPYRCQLLIRQLKKRSSDFWPTVTLLRNSFQDGVKQISLDLEGCDAADHTNQMLSLLTSFAKRAKADTVVMVNAKGDGEVDLDEVYDDMTQIAAICVAQKGYNLSVKFRHFGVYRYGHDLLAQFGVDDQLLTQFDQGVSRLPASTGDLFSHELPSTEQTESHPFGTNGLLDWLDTLHKLLKDYEHDVIQIRRKRSRRK